MTPRWAYGSVVAATPDFSWASGSLYPYLELRRPVRGAAAAWLPFLAGDAGGFFGFLGTAAATEPLLTGAGAGLAAGGLAARMCLTVAGEIRCLISGLESRTLPVADEIRRHTPPMESRVLPVAAEDRRLKR